MSVCILIEGEYEEKGPGHIVRSGRGTHTCATGTVYSGEWQNDLLSGRGAYATMHRRNVFTMHTACCCVNLRYVSALGEVQHTSGAVYKVKYHPYTLRGWCECLCCVL